MSGIFSDDIFGDDGLAGLAGLEPFEMGTDATDGDLALILWTMNALEPSMAIPGPAAIMKGMRQLAVRRGIDPNAAVQIQNNRYMIDDRIMTEVRGAQVAANALTDAQRTQLRNQLDAARSGGAMMPMPMPGSDQARVAERVAQVFGPGQRTGGAASQLPNGQSPQLLPGAGSSAPRWLPYALIGGGVLVAGGLVWMAARRPRTATANRRRRHRR